MGHKKHRSKKRKHKIVLLFVVLFILSILLEVDPFPRNIFNSGAFFVGLYLLLSGTWMGIKKLDSINLKKSSNIWLLRLFGGMVCIVGMVVTVSGVMAASFVYMVGNSLPTDNLPWIVGLCLIGLGGFSIFRSDREMSFIHVKYV